MPPEIQLETCDECGTTSRPPAVVMHEEWCSRSETVAGERGRRIEVDGREAVFDGRTGGPLVSEVAPPFEEPTLHEVIGKLREEIGVNAGLKDEYSELGKAIKKSSDRILDYAKRICALDGDPQMHLGEAPPADDGDEDEGGET